MLDKFRETAITWDKANRKVYEPLRVSAGDNKGRKLSVQVVNSGVIENLSGASLSLFWETKDKAYKGLDAFTAVDATKGEFEIYYTTGMLSNEGTLNASLVLVDTSGRVVSEPFTITVFKGIDDDAIQSSDSFTALTEALIDISDLEQNYAPRLSTLEQNDVSLSQQLQQKVGDGTKAKLEDLDSTVLSAIAGGEGTSFELLSIPQPKSVTDSTISPESSIVLKRKGKNLLNINSFLDGYYVDYTNGGVRANAGLVLFDYVELESNTDYVLSRNDVSPIEQFILAGPNKEYISGMLPTNDITHYTFNTGQNIRYIRLSGRKTKYPTQELQIEKGTARTSFAPYHEPKIHVSDLETGKLTSEYLSESLNDLIGETRAIIKTVIPAGGGDFTTIRQAVDSITDASASKPYEIHISEGNYDLFSDYTTAEINATTFLGIVKKNYVSFIGTGRKEKTTLRGALPDDALSATISRVAPIVTYGEGTLENLTVRGKNTRYAIHDDYNYPNTKRRMINCEVIKEAGLGLTPAYGAGSYSGMEFEFENSKFHTESTGFPLSFHNNVNFTKPSIFKFDTCDFVNQNGEYAVRFGSMGSGQTESVEMIGCKFNGKILLNEEVAGSGVGIDFKLKGWGNSLVPVAIINSSTKQATYEFVGETELLWNQSFGTIPKGKPVKLTAKGNPVAPMTGSDSPILFAGVACQDIPSFSFGVVRKKGYLPVADTGLTVAVGDKIGVINGALSVVTEGDYVGYVEIPDFITLL